MNGEFGKQYGYLIVLEDTGKKYHSTKIYKCRCVCGNIVEVNLNKLHTGHVKSCGCRRFRWKDLTGQKFGRLTVHEFAYTQNRKNYWKRKCDCGNICYVQTSWLTNGTTVSCGCKNYENRANLPKLDRGMVDGTMTSGIQKDRKRNRNNTSGVTGVHFDRERGLWVAQIMFQRKAYLLGRFKRKSDAIKARKAGEDKFLENIERSETDMAITINIYYTGKNGSARAFAEEMMSTGVVEDIRKESGNLKYEYFTSWNDPETILLIDRWENQKALNIHHASPMMKRIAELMDKYDLTMKVERFVDDDRTPRSDDKFIRK